MFFRTRKRQRQDAWALEQARLSYESAVRQIYGHDRVTLAIARIGFVEWRRFEGKTVRSSPREVEMNGVLHDLMTDDRRVKCEVGFLDDEPAGETLGHCHLTHLFGDEKKPIETRQLLLQVALKDAGSTWSSKVYDAMRDAAVSGGRFLHFRLDVQKQDAGEALAMLRSKGTGPRLNVVGFMMWPHVILPNAPVWGWKGWQDD